jgi:hypothetical protein
MNKEDTLGVGVGVGVDVIVVGGALVHGLVQPGFLGDVLCGGMFGQSAECDVSEFIGGRVRHCFSSMYSIPI